MNLCNVKNAYDMIIIHQQLIEFMNSYVDEKDKEWFFMLLKKQKETKGPRFSAAFLKDWGS